MLKVRQLFGDPVDGVGRWRSSWVNCWFVWPRRGHDGACADFPSSLGSIESGERRLDVVEFVAVAKALKVDPIDLFTRFVRAS